MLLIDIDKNRDSRTRRCQFVILLITLNLHVPPQKQFSSPQLQKAATSQIEGPTLRNSFGFKFSLHDLKTAKAVHEVSQGQLWDSSSQLPYGLCDIRHVNSQSPHRAVPVVISNGLRAAAARRYAKSNPPPHPPLHVHCMHIHIFNKVAVASKL